MVFLQLNKKKFREGKGISNKKPKDNFLRDQKERIKITNMSKRELETSQSGKNTDKIKKSLSVDKAKTEIINQLVQKTGEFVSDQEEIYEDSRTYAK